MKTIILSVSFCVLSVFVFGQTAPAVKPLPNAKTTMMAATLYVCPMCNSTSLKPGVCTKDKTTLVKVGDYYCPECYMSAKKPGKCPMCGVAMKRMDPPAPSKGNK